MKKIIFTLLIITGFSTTCISQTLHIYGGQNQDEYLGCLNCNNYDKNSIWNEYGTYGSEYNSNSPWNSYGSNPPVIVDKDGEFYVYFTVN